MADKINKNKHRLSRVFKRALALFIIVIINFNSFSAVVSSNDGSAFITKAEFDALVNDFNSRIEDYEKSIDAKIDGAIAEYLAGLATASSYIMEDLIHVAKVNNNNNLKFIQWKIPQASKDVDDVSAGFHLMWSWGSGTNNNETLGRTYGYITVSNQEAWAGSMALRRYTDYTDIEANYTNSYYYAYFPFASSNEVEYISEGNTTDFVLKDLHRFRCHFDIMASKFVVTAAQNSVALADLDYAPTTITCDFTGGLTKNGPGTINGPNVSVGSISARPQMTITHSYSLTSSSDSTNNDFLNYNIARTISGNAHFIDYSFRNNYNNHGQVDLEIQATRPISNIADYKGQNSGTAVQALREGTTWSSLTGKKGYGNNTSFRFKYNHQQIYNLNWPNLVNDFYSTYFNTPYYKYYGIPICKPNKMTGDITFKLKFTNTKVGDIYPAFTYQINDVKFSNGDLPSASNVLYNETVPQGNSSYTKEITITKDTVKDTTNGDYLYIKIQPSVENQIVSVDTEGDILITIEA